MKKIASVILLLVFLVGCSPIPEEIPSTEVSTEPTVLIESPTEEMTTPATELPTPDYKQLPMLSIYVPHHEVTEVSNDGTVIFRQTRQSMQLIHQDADVADRIILDFLNRIDQNSVNAEQIHNNALSQYQADQTWDTYFHDQTYAPMRIDFGVLSLYGETVSYEGGYHPQRICTAANYNMVTGEVLTLGSILYHIDALTTLESLVLEELSTHADEWYLLDGYEEIVHQRFLRDESFDEDWYFTETGLCFYFPPYEIAPYSSGVITAQISYSKLTGIIADDFFPPEKELTEGTIHAVQFDNANVDQFTQITEVSVDNEGEMYLLYCNGAVSNICLLSVAAADNMYGNTEPAAVFKAYSLTPGDAIMLKIDTDNINNPMLLVFESNGTQNQIELTQDFLNN